MLTNRSRLAGPTWAGLMIAVAVALAACTGGSDEAAPVPTIELTTTTVPTTTTTTEQTTTTEDPNLALVEAAYRDHLAYGRTHGLEINEDALRAVTAEPLLSRKIEALQDLQARNISLGSNDYDIHVLDIKIAGVSAIVTSCNLDGVSLLTADGSEYVPADEVRFIRITELTLLDIGWRVTDTGFGEGEKTECEF